MSRWWLGKAEVVAKQRTQKQLDCDLAGACRHYVNGYCSWGVKCRFRHERVLAVETLATSETLQTSNPREVLPSARALRQMLISEASQPANPQEPSPSPVIIPPPTTATGDRDRGGEDPGDSGDEDGTDDPGDPNQKDEKWKWRRPAARLWLHIYLHLRHMDFDLVPMLIGRKGIGTRAIAMATDSKLRVRGRGSKHLEVEGKKEAPVPLMIAITANKADCLQFRKGVDLLVHRLLQLSDHYKCFCAMRDLPIPTEREPLFSFGEFAISAEAILVDLLRRYPHPGGPKMVKFTPTPGGMFPNVIVPDDGCPGSSTDVRGVRRPAQHVCPPSHRCQVKTTPAPVPSGAADIYSLPMFDDYYDAQTFVAYSAWQLHMRSQQTIETAWNSSDSYYYYGHESFAGDIVGQPFAGITPENPTVNAADPWREWGPNKNSEVHQGDCGDQSHADRDAQKAMETLETKEIAVARHLSFIKQNYDAITDRELTVKEGDAVYIGDKDATGWTHVELAYIGNRTKLRGWIPGWSLCNVVSGILP